MLEWLAILTQWFIRPGWLLLLPVVIGFIHYTTGRDRWGGWDRFVARRHLPLLVTPHQDARRGWRTFLIYTALTLCVVAMAGPSWQQQDGDGFKNRHPLVVLFDLSESMLAWDVTPSRLVQAKLKLTDLLQRRLDGETGLLVYAADAFQVAPLTDDPQTIIELLDTLHPDVMPAPGSHTEAAIQRGIEMIRDAGQPSGDLLLITDGVAPAATRAIIGTLPNGFRLSILAVGTRDTVAVPARGGGFVRQPDGQPVSVTTDHHGLAALARQAGGQYTELTVSDQDITALESTWQRNARHLDVAEAPTERRRDGGALLVLLLLPVAALAFRRGELFVVALLMGTPLTSHAASWADWWLTPDQQASRLLHDGRPDLAADRFNDPEWAAIASYRARQLDRAAQRFSKLTADTKDPTTALFNLATTVMVQGRLALAIELYEQVLDQQPQHPGALHNVALARETLTRIKAEREQLQRDRNPQAIAAPNGQDNAPQGNTEQSQQVGGASIDGNTDGEQALQESGTASRQNAPQQKADEQRGMNEWADTQPAETLQTAPRPEQGENASLNPYSEQWLRNQQADPGYMLRRKLRFQARQRAPVTGTNPPRRY